MVCYLYRIQLVVLTLQFGWIEQSTHFSTFDNKISVSRKTTISEIDKFNSRSPCPQELSCLKAVEHNMDHDTDNDGHDNMTILRQNENVHDINDTDMQQFKQTSNVTASCTSNQNVDVSQSGISRPEDMDIKKDVDEPLNFTKDGDRHANITKDGEGHENITKDVDGHVNIRKDVSEQGNITKDVDEQANITKDVGEKANNTKDVHEQANIAKDVDEQANVTKDVDGLTNIKKDIDGHQFAYYDVPRPVYCPPNNTNLPNVYTTYCVNRPTVNHEEEHEVTSGVGDELSDSEELSDEKNPFISNIYICPSCGWAPEMEKCSSHRSFQAGFTNGMHQYQGILPNHGYPIYNYGCYAAGQRPGYSSSVPPGEAANVDMRYNPVTNRVTSTPVTAHNQV
jgi:hypothetical protein